MSIRSLISVFLCLLHCLAVGAQVPLAQNDRARIITTGWNAPTAQQFARDYRQFAKLPFSGSVVVVRAEGSPVDPLSKAHSVEAWDNVSFSSTEIALDSLSAGQGAGSYLILKANPGDTDWFDDQAWQRVVDRWRIAARLAKRGKLRGLLFDPEPYKKPFKQFEYNAQANAAEHAFGDYAVMAQKRGHEVMTAIAEEYPEMELASYFWMSYLVNHHGYRGPSPINGNDLRREDYDWCLAGHAYGLLPSFLTGLLEASPAEFRLIDGCEYGYWLTEPNEFAKLAHDVRTRGRMLVDASVRKKYDAQMRVGFPVFVDIVEPTIIPKWVISPEVTDRLAVLRRQLTMAIQAGDGFVWLYGERGRWWPDPTNTALWHNKDVYPLWSDRIAGCVEVIGEVRDSVEPASLPYVPALPISPAIIGPPIVFENWTTWVHPESDGQVKFLDPTSGNQLTDKPETERKAVIEIRGAKNAAALCSFPVTPGQRYRVSAKARQNGRGLIKMALRFRDDKNNWLVKRGIDSIVYPHNGDPNTWRTIEGDAVVPEGAAHLVVTLAAKNQIGSTDFAEFGSFQGHLLKESN
ncbi:hypothetical protein CA13_39820 [Planctomycetes bacterium CA13]|uniref:Carbohydrate binding domain protein n=1 Tax=Novipirellula herctigrandis TaxID=2527986 RepID=A0A5C5Z553_9BACT|nr:hypothetical protein CA13_39820 [Planctomycetes bacterium CA13]